jgi:hypothetical protein
LLEHIRIAQEDIVDFIRNPNYKERAWPADYWPPRDKQATPDEWRQSVDGFRKGFSDLTRMIEDPKTDLYGKVQGGHHATFLLELVILANHTAFHLGEFAVMRQVMGTWGKGHRH